MAARGNNAKKKDKRRRHAKTRKAARDMALSRDPSPSRRSAKSTPSKTAADQSLAQRQDDLATLGSALDHREVMDALAAQGFTRDQVNGRLAQLNPQELNALASQVDQLQAAGQSVPTYIWILIAVLIVVAIIAVAD